MSTDLDGHCARCVQPPGLGRTLVRGAHRRHVWRLMNFLLRSRGWVD